MVSNPAVAAEGTCEKSLKNRYFLSKVRGFDIAT
jgi:hypothetical protein